MEDPRVLKVFHFARFDVAALLHYLGIEVAPLYCTRTVSKLVRTYTDRHGLKDNLLELLDVELDKTVRHSDWSAETLSEEQVRYALSDVTLLLPLMDKLDAMLVRRERKELAEECFRAISDLRPARSARLREPARALSPVRQSRSATSVGLASFRAWIEPTSMRATNRQWARTTSPPPLGRAEVRPQLASPRAPSGEGTRPPPPGAAADAGT